MTAAAAATAATFKPNSAMCQQIRLMHTRDSATAEEISLMLEIPLMIVLEVLEPATKTAGEITATHNGDSDQSYTESLQAAREIESGVRAHQERAIEVLGECLESDVDGIRLAASTRILDITAGKLRPKKDPQQTGSGGTITIEQFNMMVTQAMGAYQKQIAPAQVTVDIPSQTTK